MSSKGPIWGFFSDTTLMVVIWLILDTICLEETAGKSRRGERLNYFIHVCWESTGNQSAWSKPWTCMLLTDSAAEVK